MHGRCTLAKRKKKKVVTYSVEPLAFFTPFTPANGHLATDRVNRAGLHKSPRLRCTCSFGEQLEPFLSAPMQLAWYLVTNALVQKSTAKVPHTLHRNF